MKLTPHTVPNLLALGDETAALYARLRTMVGDLAAFGFPDEVIMPLYTAADQLKHATANLAKSGKKLVVIEKTFQHRLHLSAPNIKLPTHSFRLDIDGEVELEDVLEEKAREAYVRFDMAGRRVRLYQRPVTTTDPQAWETIDYNYNLDTDDFSDQDDEPTLIPFDESPVQDEWIANIRSQYGEEMGPKECWRLAADYYYQLNGVLPTE
jgi:hypothetical protein